MSKKHVIGTIVAAGLILSLSLFLWIRSSQTNIAAGEYADTLPVPADSIPVSEPPVALVPVLRDIPVAAYFAFMDSVVARYDSLVPYVLTEHLIVRANPWIIDTLENTDYYRRIALGRFVYDQKTEVVLKAGDSLRLPGPQTAAALLAAMAATRLDINIPAYRLRIVAGDSILYSFPVRVGKNQQKFLAMAGRVADLRTLTGTGEIIRINRYPVFYDPVTGDIFKYTKRDDRNYTLMPQIPWLEPAINGQRYGQMIHPTTNPATLGKPASNGCIGTREADAWRIYYYAPVGTPVVIRYDLTEANAPGDTLRYKDIYQYQKKSKKTGKQASLAFPFPSKPNACWCLP